MHIFKKYSPDDPKDLWIGTWQKLLSLTTNYDATMNFEYDR